MNQYTIDNVARRKQGNTVYFFGALRNDIIKMITEVLVIEKSPKTFLQETTTGGYQRPAAYNRQRQIKDYLINNKDSYVPPVLLNGAGHWIFKEYDSTRPNFGKLEVEGLAHIIDGQHRLGGYIAAWEEAQEEASVDFIAFENLPPEREQVEFNVINTTQKGVPKAISTYITRDENTQNWVAWEFNQREDSPFSGRISRLGKLSGNMLLNLQSVAKNVVRTFDHGSLEDLDKEICLDYLIKYWSIIRDTYPEEWSDGDKPKGEWEFKMMELTGFIAWSLIGPKILGRAYDPNTATMNWEIVEKLVARIKPLDWTKEGKYNGRTGEVGGKEIMRDMERLVDPPQPQ
jgi:DNA sulfur modification protein DndB